MNDRETATLLRFRKSSYSGSGNGSCVEVAGVGNAGFVVRDSKEPSGPTLAFTSADWTPFLALVKATGVSG